MLLFHVIGSGTDFWISMDSELANKLMASRTYLPARKTMVEGNNTLLLVNELMIPKVNQFIHKQSKGCGGFVAHKSFKEGQEYLARLRNGFKSEFNPPSIDNRDVVDVLKNMVETSRMSKFISELVRNFKNRYYTSDFGVQASKWIKEQWKEIVSSRGDIDVSSYVHSSGYEQNSIIVTIEGSEQDDEIVVIGAHLDSTLLRSPKSWKFMPGADDNASGITVLTEALRIIVAAGYKPKKTIQIMGYAAEEIGLLGSREIAKEYNKNKKNVIGMANFDVVGNKGETMDICLVKDRYSNHELVDFLSRLIDEYLPGVEAKPSSCDYPCSDHASWTENGFPATLANECEEATWRWHTKHDTVDKVNIAYMSNFARLVISYLAELAKGTLDLVTPPISDNQLENGVSMKGLSAYESSKLFFTFIVPQNANYITFSTEGGRGDSDLYVKFGSKPTRSDFDCSSYNYNNDERCDVESYGPGIYHVMIFGYSEFSDVKLMGTYE